MIRSAYPYFSFLLLLIPVLVFILLYHARKRKQLLLQIADSNLIEKLLSSYSPVKDNLKSCLVFTCFIMIMLALIGFEVGTKYEQVKISGVDIVFALDVSASMNAEDIKPSRLEKAKHEISTFLDQLRGDRVALVIFAGQAFIQCPMTTDYSAVRMFLDAVTVNTTTSAGTNFAEALDVISSAFPGKPGDEKASTAGKAAVIFSDGEDHNPESYGLLENLKKQNIKIFAVGIGTANAAPIPIYDETGTVKDFKKINGSVITTRLEEGFVSQLASETGGAYYAASTNELEVKKIYQEISKLEKSENSDYQFTEFENRYQWFLLLAIVSLCIDLVIHRRKIIKE
ncbi:VWA domain-containing protein [bacterium]|nr:VWA domain-containing protein [bacterium]